jgi:hypothetical protein
MIFKRSVDDPSGRVDKTDGRNVKNEKMFFTLSPTALPTLRPQDLMLYNNNFFKYF